MPVKTSSKVRISLFVLTWCFALSAFFMSRSFDSRDILEADGQAIERNLHRKERLVRTLLEDTSSFEMLKELPGNDSLAQNLLERYSDQHRVFVYTYSNNDLIFWGSDRVVPQSDAGLLDGSSFLTTENGWFEAIKKTSGAFSAVALIPIKSNYALNNAYLGNRFDADLTGNQNLEVASFSDTLVYNIRNIDGQYLLSVKLKDPNSKTLYSSSTQHLWFLTLLFLSLWVTTVCIWIANSGKIKLSILLLFSYLAAIRIIDLKIDWMRTHFISQVFQPSYYGSGSFSPSLGDFFLNILSVAWFMCYVYSYRFQLIRKEKASHRLFSLFMYMVIATIVVLVANQSVSVFSDLVQNSNIIFDVTNILRLDALSWLGIFSLCLVLLILFLLLETLFAISMDFQTGGRFSLVLFLMTVCFYAAVLSFTSELTVSFFVFSLIVLIRAYSFYNQHKFNLAVFIATLLLFSCIASIKLTGFLELKELDNQRKILTEINAEDNPNILEKFSSIEKSIGQDPVIRAQLEKGGQENREVFHNYIRRTYFGEYLSKFELTTSLLPGGEGAEEGALIANYKNRVANEAVKVSGYFYRYGAVLSNVRYFGLIPILYQDEVKGTLLIELSGDRINRYTAFPDVLSTDQMRSEQVLDDYSYAFYRQGSLVYQFGTRVFPTTDDGYPAGEVKQYSNISNRNKDIQLAYRPTEEDLMVISKPKQGLWLQLASLSFLFLVLLLFSIVAYIIKWLTQKFRRYDFSLRSLKKMIQIGQHHLLYSTRIQASIVFIVVNALIITGIITFFSTSNQYQRQRQMAAVKQVNRIASNIETDWFLGDKNFTAESLEGELSRTAANNATDIELYNASGELLYASQAKIYDLGFLSPYMNPEAWFNLVRLGRSEFLHEEEIGQFRYSTAYAPIKNNLGEPIAYLSLPNFSSSKENYQHFGMLINTLIDIYALVIVVIGLFAVFVANRITEPLTLIQRNLAKLSMDRTNETIEWERNDEIGALVREYNQLVIALDDSANKIAQSERESAWREMAKQVAHEIKNPLTPLKLGVQLLERSWRENDPKFDQKFERFIHSFIEQIDSLSTIASEFSNFAKMPDTKFDRVDILEVIEKVIPIYSSNPAVGVFFKYPKEIKRLIVLGDRDQLLRSFTNLIKNAIEAKPSGKCIIQLQVSVQGERISIAIRDNGNGIREEVRERIFQPNFTTKSSGTGLGLAFVKQTVESMHGIIYYETRINRGTTFFITVPSDEIVPI